MIDVTTPTAIYQSFKTLTDMATALIGLRDAALIDAKVNELLPQIAAANSLAIATQTECMALREEAAELKKKLAEIENWEAESEKYELREVTTGVFAMVDKETVESDQYPVRYCAACFERRRKSILQLEDFAVGRVLLLACHGCGAKIQIRGKFQTNTL